MAVACGVSCSLLHSTPFPASLERELPFSVPLLSLSRAELVADMSV